MSIAEIIKKYFDLRFIITLLICLVIFSPFLAFPLGWDHAIFMKMAKILLNGGTLYKDAIDLKPPMVYYFFELIIRIFGSSDFSMRLAELILNMTTCGLLFFVMKKFNPDTLAKFLAPIIYSLSYSSLDFGDSFQSETIIAPSMLFIIYLSIAENQTWKRLSLIGLMFGLVVAFKYTFIVFFVAWLIYYYMAFRPKISHIAITVLTFTLVSIIIVLTAFIGNVWPFLDINRYLAVYTANTQSPAYLLYSFNASFAVFCYSVISMAVLLGPLYLFWNKSEVFAERNISHLANLSYCFILAGFVSVFIEMRFYTYHYSRTLVFISILSSFGLSYLLKSFNKNYDNKLLAGSIIILLFMLSPLPQAIQNFKSPIFLKSGQIERYNERFYKVDIFKMLNPTVKMEIIGKIKSDKSRDWFKTSFICSSGAFFNRLMGNETYSRFSNSQFMLAEGISRQWKSWFIDELNNSDWLVINTTIRWQLIYGNKFSPYENIKRNSEYNSIICRRFEKLFETESYVVFRRK